MRLARLGSFHPTRLSFVRSLVRRMGRERWIFRQRCHDLDASGFGRIVYEIETPAGLLTFCGFSNALAPEERTDRVIAEKWDTAFALSAGRIDEAAIERLSQSAPRQEAARYGADELVLSRANRSVRLFDKVSGGAGRRAASPISRRWWRSAISCAPPPSTAMASSAWPICRGSGATASSPCPMRRRC